MQTTKLPIGICDAIEKIIRSFIWGANDEKRKPSLLRWDTLCTPTAQGGGGFKSLQHQNNAFLSKLAFLLANQPDTLWVQVLRAKYNW